MKKILALLTAIAMSTALLAGCGEDNPKSSLGKIDAQVGEYITFGKYEQDNDTFNGKEDIEWLVLDVEGDRALVISRYGLDTKLYHEENEEITWEDCTLREWLNDNFYNEAFSSAEKSRIPTVTVTAEDNFTYDTDAGNDTEDKVFLLSIREAERYFSSDEERICEPTDYAVAQGTFVNTTVNTNGSCAWWLRSPGDNQDTGKNLLTEDHYHIAVVAVHGDVFDIGGPADGVDAGGLAVRPAMWIELND